MACRLQETHQYLITCERRQSNFPTEPLQREKQSRCFPIKTTPDEISGIRNLLGDKPISFASDKQGAAAESLIQ